MLDKMKRIAGIHKKVAAAEIDPFKAVVPQDGPAIELRQVSYSYTKKPFIESLDLKIPRGCITSIIGPNGCGKSTLLKIVDGLIKPDSGEAFIDDLPTLIMGGRERARHLALLAQGARPPAMTVEALVGCGRYPYQGHLHLHSVDDKRYVEEAMVLAGVERFRDHDVRYLSGGERQRAFIAMTLAQDAGIIALDEPTTYLDVHACHDVMKLTQELNHNSEKTIVMVIHDLDLALRYSDYLIVMERGACLCAGTRDEVLASHAIEQAFQVEVRKAEFEGRDSYTLFPLW